MDISFIIPYMHNSERYILFKECINKLKYLMNDKMEICIHEIGDRRHLPLRFSNMNKYLFTEYTGVFHRAWVLNVAVKKLSSGKKLVLLDGDLILTHRWLEETRYCSERYVAIAWGKLYCMTKEETENYIVNQSLKNLTKGITKRPKVRYAAGAASLIPRDIYFKTKGVPEMFKGTWGGNDNALFKKFEHLGIPFKEFHSTIYHMYHDHKTYKDKEIIENNKSVLKWDKEQWMDYIENIGDNWGEL